MPPDEQSLIRLENKVDKLTEAVVQLARIDERQEQAARNHIDLVARVAVAEAEGRATKALLERWINRGIGAWAIFGSVAAIGASIKFFVH